MILATHRDEETTQSANLLRSVVQELGAHRQCLDLSLQPLREPAVTEYLRRSIAADAVPAALAHQVYRRTGGNPLFMVALVEHLHARGVAEGAPPESDLAALGVPGSVHKMIERQIEELSAGDRRLLEVASVAGVEFSAAALGAGLDGAPGSAERVDTQCEDLTRRTRFLSASGIAHWPDGTVAGRYRFRHGLYQEVLYERVSAARRARLHQEIGERIEAGHRARATEIAAELAMHFERGGDHPRAIEYLAASADTALRRSANDAAIGQANKGLELLAAPGSGPERLHQELRLQLVLGAALMARSGMAAPQVQKAYARAHELVTQIGEQPALVPVLLGLARFHIVRDELDAAQTLVETCVRLAQSSQDEELLLEAHVVTAAILYSRDSFSESLAHAEQATRIYDPHAHRSHALRYGIDPGVLAKCYAAMSLWRLGYPDQSRKRGSEAVALGEELAHSHSLAMALTALASIHERCRDWPAAQGWAEKLSDYAAEKELPLWHAWGEILRGLACAEQGDLSKGVPLIRSGLAGFGATGGNSRQPESASLLIRVRAGTIPLDEALRSADAMLVAMRHNGESNDEAELQRIIGVLKRQRCEPAAATTIEAEESFRQAIETARSQQAKALELRAAIGLCRLLRDRGQGKQALTMLTGLYDWFTEGFDTGDLREANALIAELGS